MTTSKTVNAKAPKTAAKAGNGWTDEATELAINMYQAVLNTAGEAGGPENANDPSTTLSQIQEAVKALGVDKSIVAVRSKLISEKVYQKADAPRKVGGGSSLRKVHFVRALAKRALELELIDDIEAFDSLEQAKAEPLKALAKMLEIEVTA